MMHRFSFLIIMLFAALPFFGNAQDDPIKWTTEARKTGPNEYELVFTAALDKGWHVYSQFIDEGGPVPTTFSFDKGKYEKKGKVEEKGHAEKIYDKGFEMNLVYFSGKSDFVQRVKITGPTQAITGNFEFMVCNDEMCLPPKKIDFSFPVQYESGTK